MFVNFVTKLYYSVNENEINDKK